MSTLPFFQALQNSEIAVGIGQSNHLYGVVAQIFHIAGLVLILAPVLLVNLRLLGTGLVNQSVPHLVKATNPLIWIGFLSILFSGIFMFAPSAALYYPNPAFWLKFQLLAAALVVQFTLYRKVTASEKPNRALAVTTAIISLTLWFGVGIAGRAIGYVAA
ncbi:MAG: hypothetical protein EOO52_02695 [Gammaproteobacteria bacterium]|nr:MAG: hypothetical protein EOO52_02695 [Gammaproteobacteria bacterium]